jgi:riboflavin-specific deaminase-like protein
MTMTRIDRVWPDSVPDVDDDTLVTRPDGPWLRVNFVSSVDGGATADGLSGGLSGDADKRVFELLRRTTDAVLVGAGTVRSEGYGAMRVSDASVAWRTARGLSEHPVFVIVSGSLDLDPASEVFTKAPVLPIVVTTGTSREASRARFEGLARVIVAGNEHLDVAAMLVSLRELGLDNILSEGGPTLFGSLLESGAVDELRLTVSPVLVAGDAKRISGGPLRHPIDARLDEILLSGDVMMLRYLF